MLEPVTGMPGRILRLEGLALLALGCLAYGLVGGSWPWFAVLFFVPDVSMLGYLRGPRLGALLYNLGHTTLAPLLVGGIGIALDSSGWHYALIWLAHIGFDRALGYGLKYPSGFGATHLQRRSLGPRPRDP